MSGSGKLSTREFYRMIRERNHVEVVESIIKTLNSSNLFTYAETARRVVEDLKIAGYSIRRFKAR